jgi:putative membrane protein
MRPRIFRALVFTIAGTLVACSHKPPQPVVTTGAPTMTGDPMTRMQGFAPAENPLESSGGGGVNPQPNAQPTTAEGGGPSDVLTKVSPRLTDGEVLGVLVAANQGEVEMADLAIRDATASDVRQFAAMMKNHHTTGLQKTKSVAAKTKIASTPGDVSAYLEREVTTALNDLKSKSGGAFDRAYMDTQVKAHRDVLSAIDHRLVISAANGDVRSLVTEARQMVAGHLAKAEEIQSRMQPAASR